MRTVNIHEARTHLSKLVDQANAGQEIVIARAGKPVARLISAGKQPTRRSLGALAGRFSVPTDFDAPLPEDVVKTFEGRS